MADSKNVPTLQYALFCREVIENPDELTFRGVLGKVVVGRPKDIVLTLVLGLRNIAKGAHKIDINCLVPPLELLKYNEV